MKFAAKNQGIEGPPYPLKDLFRDLWRYIRPHKGSFFLATLLRIVSDIAALYPPYAIGRMVTILSQTGFTKAVLIHESLFVVITWGIAISFRYLTIYLAKRIGLYMATKVFLDVHVSMLEVLFARDSAWHEKESSGSKLKRVSNGADSYNLIIRTWINNLIEIVVRFISIPFILATFDHTAALIMIFFMVTYFCVSYFLAKPALKAAYQVSIDEEGVHGVAFEALSNVRSVQVLDLSGGILVQIRQAVTKLLASYRARIKAFQFRGSFSAWYGDMFRVVSVAYLAFEVIQGRYAIGFLVTFSSYFFNIWESVRELSDVSQDLIIATQMIGRMHDLIGRVPDDAGVNRGSIPFPETWKEISLENISFSYGDHEALSNVSFTIKRGEKVGVVGLSGAGKSTLFKLLLKERMNWKGKITLGAVPLENIKTDEYRNHVSVVLQETEVFNLTLRQNILLGNTTATEEDLNKALTVAHVRDFIAKLPQGLDTVIGEKGIKLSGGEKQRLGIARAVVRKPSILFLDEATSHLDLESEEKIKQSLHEFFQSVTAVVIAHRLTTIREMDRIIVVEGGRIVEEGSFEALHAKKGRFYELWEKQHLG